MIARLLAHLKLAHKFLILGALVLATMGWTIWLLVGALQEQIDFSAKEVRGAEYHRAAAPLLAAIQTHGEAIAAGLRGQRETAAAAKEAELQADRAVEATDAADKAHGEVLAVRADWQRIRDGWSRLKAVATGTPEEILERHAALAVQITAMLDAIGDNSNLVLDPDLDTFYLMSASVGQLPHMQQATSRARSTAVTLATRGSMSAADSRAIIAGTTELGLRNAQTLKALGESMKATPAVKAAVEGSLGAMEKALEDLTRTFDESFIGQDRPKVTPTAIFAIAGRTLGAQSQLYDASIAMLDTLLRARVDRLVAKRNTILTIVGAMVLVVVLLGFIVIRDMVRRLGRATGAAGDISGGRFDGDIQVIGTDEIEQLNASFKQMQQNLRERIERDTKMLADNHRIRQALDSSTTNLRVCDDEGTVLFANRALLDTTRSLESAIRRRIPAFKADELVGSSIGVFYDEPEKMLAQLRSLDATRRSMLEIGGRQFEIVTHPVLGERGERLGSVGEWIDRTDQLAAEKQMAEIIEAASRGELDSRLQTESMSGFYKAVGSDINNLLDTLGAGLGEVARVLRALGEGDLTQRMTGQHRGVFAELRTDCDRTMDRISSLLLQIREGSESIRTAASEISQGNTDLSARTEQQASSLEETASSMEELTSTVKQNADNAKQANQLAMGASASAQKGGETVKQVVATMSEIAESSRRIQDIIGVIDGIAFQTNILALNAAVEAARAGEQGRGFAVVASEVRTLAQRSAAAAKEIKGLIGESATKVEAGATLVDEAGEQMQEIVLAVRRVTDIMGEIAAASSEQSSGIEQVGQAVTSMDQVTQQNAALVEEAAAAAESLLEQSEQLMGAVSVFRLERRHGEFGTEAQAGEAIARASRSAERAVTATSPERGVTATSLERAVTATSLERAVTATSPERAVTATSLERASGANSPKHAAPGRAVPPKPAVQPASRRAAVKAKEAVSSEAWAEF